MGRVESPAKEPVDHFSDYPPNWDPSSWSVRHDLFLLHAIPKCGTHYIERIIRLITNKDVCCQNISHSNLRRAYRKKFIIRTFEPYSLEAMQLIEKNRHRLIALIRDPRDALISHVFYMRTYADDPNSKFNRDFFTVGANFDLLTLEKQIKSLIVGDRYAPSYIQFYKERMGWALQKNTLVVKFEDLVEDPIYNNKNAQEATILKIAQYLHLYITVDHLEYVLENMFVKRKDREENGKLFHRSSVGNWRTFLNEEHKALLKNLIGKELIQLGYEKDLDW